MARSLHVRLDDSAAAALGILKSTGLSDSEAVRSALRDAASRRTASAALREEAARLAADESDRRLMEDIREQMSDLAPR